MSRAVTELLGRQDRPQSWSREWTKQAATVISASLFVAVCAHVSVPLPFTPIPLTLSNFAVLAVGLTLGSRRGFAALALYLMEGAMGLPVFSASPLGGGIAQMLGPTGGFLMAFPFVAFIAGWLYEHTARNKVRSFGWAALSSVVAEIFLFACGLSWLAMLTHSITLAVRYGFYWFVFAEVIKVLMASGLVAQWRQRISGRA
jgi:biotin transport system substrate-specific component